MSIMLAIMTTAVAVVLAGDGPDVVDEHAEHPGTFDRQGDEGRTERVLAGRQGLVGAGREHDGRLGIEAVLRRRDQARRRPERPSGAKLADMTALRLIA